MPLIHDLLTIFRSRHLLWVLTMRELSARHAGTAAGWLWGYVQPLLTVAAYYLVFDVVFALRLGEGAPTRQVGAFLIVGAMPWMSFCDAIGRGANSLLDAGGILQKNPLPPVLFPTRAVLATMLVHGPLILLLAVAYWPMHQGAWPVLSLLPLWLMQALFCVLLAYLCAIFSAAVRDTVQIIGFLLSVGVFISPVLFPVSQFPEGWRWVLWLNPMTAWVEAYQLVLLKGEWPEASQWIAMLVWMSGVGLLLDVVVRRSRDQLVDWL
jgi:lipopolysaccharide transport system permease protein